MDARSLSETSEETADDAFPEGEPGPDPLAIDHHGRESAAPGKRRATQPDGAHGGSRPVRRSDEGEMWAMKFLQRKASSSSMMEASKKRGHADDGQPSEEAQPPLGPPAKKKKPVYSSAAENIMASMGFRAGEGLGKQRQGIVDPIEASMQRGRRGLGLKMPGLEPAVGLEWDPNQEIVEVKETFSWMARHEGDIPSLETLSSWLVEGERSLDISGETEFCDPAVLSDVLSCKSVFDNLQPEELRRARSRSNPFESIRGVFFLNRAALKMANMDARFDFMFTNPTRPDGSAQLGADELLFFADVCAGPGGFSEYALWRAQARRRLCKGFGFTLRGECDFKLHDFHAGPVEMFEPHYGKDGVNGDGDVFRPDNQQVFREFVLRQTDGQGVHFMMADGGFSVEGQENIQEILSKQLYLCQFLTALNIVRTDGHFVCKLFDLFTPFSVGLVYLMRLAFRDVCIFKPNTSRPANSERYIVCRWRRPDSEPVRAYLDRINRRIQQMGSASGVDVTHVVPLHLLHADGQFERYIRDSNDQLGRRQIVSLTKIRTFYRDSNLREDRQKDLRRQCLEYWEIPDRSRMARPPAVQPSQAARALHVDAELEALATPACRLRPDNLADAVRSQYDWRAVVLGGEPEPDRNLCLIMGLGRQSVWRRGLADGGWAKLDYMLELPADTLLLAELVGELRGRLQQPLAQKRGGALHIVDAVKVAGRDLRSLPLEQRHRLCRALAAAVNKPSRTNLTPVRCKRLLRLDAVDELLQHMPLVPVKGSHNHPRLAHVVEENGDDRSFFAAAGMLFLKCTREPWMVAFSRTQRREYWFDRSCGRSLLDCPPESVAEFRHAARSRLVWPWKLDGGGVTSAAPDGYLHRSQLCQHLLLPPR